VIPVSLLQFLQLGGSIRKVGGESTGGGRERRRGAGGERGKERGTEQGGGWGRA
jgi:hypothetical protein